jgi:protein TonB
MNAWASASVLSASATWAHAGHGRRWGVALAVSLALHAALLWSLRGADDRAPKAVAQQPTDAVHWFAASLLPQPPLPSPVTTQAAPTPAPRPLAQPIQPAAPRPPADVPQLTAPSSTWAKPKPKPKPLPTAEAAPQRPTPPSQPTAAVATAVAPPQRPAFTPPPTAAAAPADGPVQVDAAQAPVADTAVAALPSRPPQPLPGVVQPAPRYPALSRRLGEQGTVWLRAQVDATGRVQRVQLLRPSPYPRLNRAAQDAVSTWQYRPGTEQGTPVAMWLEVPVRFVLQPPP